MWGQQPRRDFASDSAMLEEVLGLLAATSPGGDCQGRAANATDNSTNPSLSATGDADLPFLPRDEVYNVPSEAAIRSFEEQQSAGYRAGQQDAALGPNSIPTHSQFAAPVGSPPSVYVESFCSNLSTSKMLSGMFPMVRNPGVAEAAAVVPSYFPPVPGIVELVQELEVVPVLPVQSTRIQQNSSQPDTYSRASTPNVLPTGQRVRVLTSAEFEEFRRKLRAQTATRRYRKRRKQEARQRKKRIQELQAELGRLQKLEAQSNQYQHRSVESLEEEFHIHKAEVSDLTGKVQDAAKEEWKWVDEQDEEEVPPVTFVQGF